jgi:hypothetical protein
MQKDIIYIDVEDDITAIIGKVKAANQKIVALVPPKHVGVLQSAVNMHLLARSATQSGKRLVLISNNPALMALSAAAKIPVAKNLQSKPELAEIPALDIDDGEDIIDGNNLPVGELARTADKIPVSGMVPGPIVDEAAKATAAEPMPRAVPLAFGSAPAKPRVKSGAKIPNFNLFRKKLLLGISGGVLLVAFLIWAFVFAPRATILITARTSSNSANVKVNLATTAATDVAAGTIKSTSEEMKKDVSVSFDATGTKDIGEKAKGTMKITRTSVSNQPFTVPLGTGFNSDGRSFVSIEAVVLDGTTVGAGGIVQDSATIGVIATDIGDTYNLSARSYQPSIEGISAVGGEMTGGTKKTVKVVTSSDVQKATEALTTQNNDSIKSQLITKLGNKVAVLDTSFKAAQAAVVSLPAVDTESTDGKAKLTSSVTYSIAGIPKDEISRYLDSYFAKQLDDKKDRRIYSNGADKAMFSNVIIGDNGYTASITATAQIGPKINDDDIKSMAKGKRYGEIQSTIQTIEGVDNVDIKFSPFWVSSAPSNTKRINVVFNLNESK